MEYSSNGYLQINAYTAEHAIPAPGLNVRVSGGEETNRGVDYSVITDRNGETEVLTLPTPSLSYSLTPNAAEQPFSKYDVQISGDGYYRKTLVGVTDFPGIRSILEVEMVPDSEYRRDVCAPRSTNFSIITESEDLQ